jgi:tRNA (adenine57-N1/adenine58-N1)-methyltransferase catalytic subunit
MTQDTVKAGLIHHSRIGKYSYNEMIGKPYGSRIPSQEGKKSVFALRMTPEMWTRTLPHRTQILYLPDISFITQMLDLRPGSRVIECGTGSGSFSHSLARVISPNGHLFTFEYHEIRAAMARKEFEEHKLSPSLLTIQHRDVCKTGFGLGGEAGFVDAVFLDLPAPWEAIPHAKQCLDPSKLTRICCFSPCIEQVQRTCSALREHNFIDIEMYECLIKEHSVYKYEEIKSFSLDQEKYKQNSADGKLLTKRAKNYKFNEETDNCPSGSSKLIGRPVVQVKGHTSYLTFASFLK